MKKYSKKVILALDTTDTQKINFLFKELSGIIEIIKIGYQSFIHFGPDIVQKAIGAGFKVFLDLKLHDIPNTIEKAIESCIKHRIHMVTLHVSGGREMIEKAISAKQQFKSDIKLLGVTVLTSFDDIGFKELNYRLPLKEMVKFFAVKAKMWGMDGIICSPMEIKDLRQEIGKNLLIITPGIRFDKGQDDQKRTLSPNEAFEAGADYIVVGRPILKSDNPKNFFENI
ncbi:MAG: orotidine-5'-phosphate decarboxylase [Proteobacteria bacterium]|nr:orotidine-5'-phosphate decarboxylase [Pseudomonadota bacterium]